MEPTSPCRTTPNGAGPNARAADAACRVRSRSGVGLVEVLVALIVLTVGVLGIAGFQARFTISSQSSYQRALAEVQAVDMVERMWLNLPDPIAALDDWETAHAGTLSEWEGSVEEINSGERRFRIRVEWRDPARATGDPAAFDHTVGLPEVGS